MVILLAKPTATTSTALKWMWQEVSGSIDMARLMMGTPFVKKFSGGVQLENVGFADNYLSERSASWLVNFDTVRSNEARVKHRKLLSLLPGAGKPDSVFLDSWKRCMTG